MIWACSFNEHWECLKLRMSVSKPLCVYSYRSQRRGMNIHPSLNYTCLVLFRAWGLSAVLFFLVYVIHPSDTCSLTLLISYLPSLLPFIAHGSFLFYIFQIIQNSKVLLIDWKMPLNLSILLIKDKQSNSFFKLLATADQPCISFLNILQITTG